ncbi:30S ribosomal protein S6 [Nesterenkonia ebinurensis]|uniref:30S ribosomal protein S6 n=1 Tax=Nesterenkonia ebinurensis TaxID=2608252 RepID=UPI00123D67B4|nr:30S ribosomal protein S6 [Nesterenkonia ebinurensis]
MRHYELMVLVDPEVDERTVEPTLGKYMELVKKDGGSVDEIDIWGRRQLSYEIQKKNEAIYAVVNFQSAPDTAKELDRLLRLNETILRTKIIRPEEFKVA